MVSYMFNIILYHPMVSDICHQLHNSNIDIAGGGVNSWQGGCNNAAKWNTSKTLHYVTHHPRKPPQDDRPSETPPKHYTLSLTTQENHLRMTAHS